MDTLLRCVRDQRTLWRSWLPLLLVTVITPPIVIAMPLVEKRLVDGVILPGQIGLLPQTVAMYGALWLLAMLCSTSGMLLRNYLVEQLIRRYRQRMFQKYETLALAFSQRRHSGQTLSLFLSDVPSLANLLSTTVFAGIGSVISITIGAAVMLSLSWQLALVAGIAPPLVAGLASVATRPLRPAARRAQEKAGEVTERLQENLSGIREVVAFGREHSQALRFATSLGELMRLRMRIAVMDTVIQSGQSLFSLSVSLVILGFGAYLVIHGQTTLGTLIAMRSLFSQLFAPASQIVGLTGGAQKALGAADRIYAFLDETPRIQDTAQPSDPPMLVGTVAFDRVSFAYQPGRPILHSVSFVAHPGEVIALVGPSGAGKSTLVSLVARFYDPTAGEVTLDGIDVRNRSIAWLRRQIGIVFQDTFLFATTIRENIAFGNEFADEAQIVAAARSAHAWEFIERLPQGLDTPVGERGVQLSEGQKQRVAIARALVRNPRILILDEPNSALDARSEHLLQQALDNLMQGRTTFVIAHRLATAQRADRILVLDGGRIVDQGTHDELVRKGGLYQELFDLQFGRPVPRSASRWAEFTTTKGHQSASPTRTANVTSAQLDR